ncbi:salicylate synthase [Streptomyces sulphureus]|uniref:salicylate synthase n=1 Tax=Streptomyces sulphureus TaxID=47758 RepID=UPI000375BAF9|nr:salicylate synthase [Streptomyces sulphureus]
MTPHYQRHHVQGPFDPLAVLTHLATAGLLTDYVVYECENRWYLAGDPVVDLRVHSDRVESAVAGTRTVLPWTASPWGALSDALTDLPVHDWRAYGWLSFELASGGPPAGDGLLGHLIVPATELTVTTDGIDVRTLDADLPARLDKTLTGVPAQAAPRPPSPVNVRTDAGTYQADVAHAVSEIGRGALEKVIVSRTVPIPHQVDMPATYALGRAHNAPARSFLLDLDGRQAAGFSPETVIEVSAEGRVTTQPLAGTRALSADPLRDRAAREDLLTDPKEVYEHASSVRVALDELSSVGGPEHTHVEEFLTVKPRGSVQHLASRVSTRLPQGRTSWEALGAVFPPVTASGIPKQAAFALIHELEEEPRDLYAGTVLRATADGALDAALVLRAVYQHEGHAWLRAGAGVVAPSRPEREYEETCEKLASVAPYVVAGHQQGEGAVRRPEEQE